MNFIKSEKTETIKNLRSQLYKKLIAPIDAMWELLYIGSSQHYLIEDEEMTIGYCCIDENNCLIQMFLLDNYNSKMNQVITELIKSRLITSAALSSNEPISFNICLSQSKGIKTNTLCFQHTNVPRDLRSLLNIELATTDDLHSIKLFLKEQVGMDDTFGYTENLISRKELFVIKESNVLIATSECRMSDSQPDIADIGIIVNKDYRGKGIATEVMQIQVNRVLQANRKPICSTTLDNVASQKAIKRAGFYRSNIIFDIELIDN
ncbi:MAG: GNAT family N-acetyltransferase [Crocinitomicaceae bacterium]|nr:GNAT family N-acetyltransferase [Flavobacteriales bacterium]NQZ34360.1 GNAT family N-acetyltransferase [Crocinitomicaceae bacterium]